MTGRLREANKAQVAEFFDVSIKAVDGWVRRGCPVVRRGSASKPWVFDLLEVARWRFQGQQDGGAANPDVMSPVDRRAWYDSEMRKRDLQIRDRELIPVAEVEQAVVTSFAAISQDIRAIPDNLERRHGIDPHIAELVEEALMESMDHLADRLGALAPLEVSA